MYVAYTFPNILFMTWYWTMPSKFLIAWYLYVNKSQFGAFILSFDLIDKCKTITIPIIFFFNLLRGWVKNECKYNTSHFKSNSVPFDVCFFLETVEVHVYMVCSLCTRTSCVLWYCHINVIFNERVHFVP